MTRSRSRVRIEPTLESVKGTRVRLAVIRIGAVAAVVAGVCWVIKSGGILLTGEQPPLLFDAALMLFPVALIGLYAALGRGSGWIAAYGFGLALAATASALVMGIAALFGPDDWQPDGDSVTILTPFIAVAGFGTFAALLLLGLAARRATALDPRWRILPLAVAVSAVPLMVSGSVLELGNERLVELPVLLLGAAWVAIGGVLARATVKPQE